MLHRVFLFTNSGSARPRWGGLLAAVVLVAAPGAWAQDKPSSRAPGDRPAAEDKRADRDRPGTETAGKDEDLDEVGRFHADLLGDARERVEILEAQIEAKRAHLKLAEARLKQAQAQLAYLKRKGGDQPDTQEKAAMLEAEIPVLEAEHDAERAEIREPLILLKHARWRVDEIEKMARDHGRRGLLGRRRTRTEGRLGMGMMGHPGMMAPMGMDHMGMGHMGLDRMTEVEDKLEQLLDAVEALEQRLAGRKNDRQ